MSASDYCIENASVLVHITSNVLEIWLNHTQNTRNKHEAFGVLIGSQSTDACQLWIEECSTPKSKDKSTRTSFELKDPFHQRMVNHHYQESKGQLGYLGTWHTHPEGIPSPSSIDIRDWQNCTMRNPDRKLLFAIVGLTHFCIYHEEKGSFERVIEELL